MNSEPPGQLAEWQLNSGGVFMRASDDEGGKLARLADVRDWLMQRNEWPMERAADEIVGKLRRAHQTGLPLFMGQKKTYARPLRSDDHMLSLEALRERGGLHELDDRLQGFEGVCNAIINGWLGEYAGYGGQFARVDAVCVRAADAAQLWGWGTVANEVAASDFPLADWPALVAYRKANRGRDWGAGNQLDIAEAELGRRTAKGNATESDALEAMAMELGMRGREALRKVIKNSVSDRKRANRAKPAPAVTVVRDGRQVVNSGG